jgi:TolB-like protein/DNA-binding winged helix-turn-helix (wHTH) protein/tetratricopeptide (TPR) repeat protein
MATTAGSGRVIRFGVFELDVRAGELRKSGVRLPIQGRPLQVLAILAQRPGELMTREELRLLLWPSDTFVDFDHGVRSAIARLRESLGDSPEAPTYIETLPRRGYRFIGRVENMAAATVSDPASDSCVGSGPVPRIKSRRRLPMAMALTLVVAIFSVVTYWLTYRTTGHTEIRSIAVLPLANLSGDPTEDYFVDGLTDEVITRLAKIGGLRVISRTSMMQYKSVHKPLPVIGSELNVDAVIEGSVRRSGNRVRITAQLIRAMNDEHLWANSYEGDVGDVLGLENDVARAVANEIRVKLTSAEKERLTTSQTVNPEVYQLILKSRFFINNQRTPEGEQRAVEYAQRAVTLDRNSALANAALADAFSTLASVGGALPREAMPKAKAAALRAISLDEKLGDAHAALGIILLNYDWDTVRAGGELRKALEFNPNSSLARGAYAHYLLLSGNAEQGIEEAKLQQKLDPLSMFANRNLGRFLYFARRYDEAIEQLRRTAELYPTSTVVYNWLTLCYEQKKMYKEAMEMDLRHRSVSGEPNEELSALRAASNKGWREYWQKVLEIEQRQYPDEHRSPDIYTRLGSVDKAIRSLQWAADQREVWMTDVRIAPEFDDLHSDARFQELLRRMSLPP